MKYKNVYYIARDKFNPTQYAKEGRETGMGRAIGRTDQVGEAERFKTPADLMCWLTGHYDGFVAVKMTETIEREIGGVVPWPSEESVWPEDS